MPKQVQPSCLAGEGSGGPFIVAEAALFKPQTGVETLHNEQELGYSPPQEAAPRHAAPRYDRQRSLP